MMKDDGYARGLDPSNYFPEAYDALQKALDFLQRATRISPDELEEETEALDKAMTETKSGMLETYFLPSEVFDGLMPSRRVPSTLPGIEFNEMAQVSIEKTLQKHQRVKEKYFKTLGSWKALQKAVRDLEAAGSISAEDSKRICNQRGLWAADIELIGKARRQIAQRRRPATADEIVAFLPVGEELGFERAWNAIRLHRSDISKEKTRVLLNEAVATGQLILGSNHRWIRQP